MNKKSIYLISSGVVLVVIGLLIILTTPKVKPVFNKESSLNKEPVILNETKEPVILKESIDNQLAFKKFVSGKFSRKYFIVDNLRDSNAIPESLKVTGKLKGNDVTFIISTLWQRSYNNNQVKIVQDKDLEHIQDLNGREAGAKYFKVVGVGGSPSSPKLLFSIPFNKINAAHMRIEELNSYKKDKIESNFFYDIEKKTLN